MCESVKHTVKNPVQHHYYVERFEKKVKRENQDSVCIQENMEKLN